MNGLKVLAVGMALCMSALALAQPVELYNATEYQYFGPTANGQRRSQHFSPTESSPNSLGSLDTFGEAAFKVSLDGGEALTGTLELFTWAGDYSSTIGGTALDSTSINLSGPFEDWITVTLASAQAATGQYLLSLDIGTVTGTDFGLWRSPADDGGNNNDAFNGDSLKDNREYQVKLSGGSLPVKAWELY